MSKYQQLRAVALRQDLALREQRMRWLEGRLERHVAAEPTLCSAI
jgi:hypothetical protein